MNEMIAFFIIVPISVVWLVLIFRYARKVDRFVGTVKKYIQERHPELKIVGQPGFGFEVETKDQVYLLLLSPVYRKYKKSKSKFEDIVENAIFSMPFECRVMSKDQFHKKHG